MFLYTIVPPEQIFSQPVKSNCYYLQVKNSFVQGVQQGDRMVVSRLISTDPHMYLDPQYAPGNLVRRSFGARPKLL